MKLNKLKDEFIAQYHENKWYWFLILALIIGGSIYRLKCQHDLDKYGVYGVAEITSYTKKTSRGASPIKYRYFVDGKIYTGRSSGYGLNCKKDDSCVGRLYEIKYVPQNPNICIIYFDRPVE